MHPFTFIPKPRAGCWVTAVAGLARLAFVLFLTLHSEPVHAVVVANSANDAARIAAAALYDGKVVSVNAAYPAGTNYPAGTVSASGTVINNQWVLTSRHFIDGLPGSTFSISTGQNFMTNPGVTLPVQRWITHSNPNIDLVLLKIDGVIPGATNAVFAAPVVGELNYYIGYGVKADLSNNTQVYDGNRRLFTAAVYGQIFGSVLGPELVFESDFGPNNQSTFAGKGWNFDSGGGVFNSLGQQTGTMLYQGGGQSYGFTGSQKLSNSAIQEWISANVNVPNLAIVQAAGSVHLTWPAAAAGWRLQTSSNLTTWSNLVVNLPGPGSWDDPIASRPQQFYRLASP